MNSLIGDPLKIGVIGAGRWGKKHIDEYLKMKDVELTWVFDLWDENLKYCKENFKVLNLTNDYHEVLSSDVEAVSICTLNQTHFDVCKDALEAGKHVLVEKPLTLKSEKAHKLVEIAKENKKLLAVGHIFRYNNAINEVKKLVEKDFFGRLFYLRLQWTTHLHPDKPLDIIVDMMPHVFDIMNYLTGLWPIKITCFGKDFRKKDLEDTAFVICEFPNKIMTHSEISWTLPEKVREVDLVGKKAAAKIQALSQEVTVFEDSNEGKRLDIKPNNTLGDELKHFVDAVKNGTIVSNDGNIGAKTVEIIECTQESLRQGKTITIG